jgi:hypothetical protein
MSDQPQFVGSDAALLRRLKHLRNRCDASPVRETTIDARFLDQLIARVTSPEEHDHEWTRCEGCPRADNEPCACSGGACPTCPTPPEERNT